MNPNVLKNDWRWWVWRITLLFVVAAVLGWPPAHTIVLVLSALQVAYFFYQEKSATAYPVQIRIVYFALTLLGMLQPIRLVIYLVLLVETFLITFVGRSLIGMGLAYLSWNKGQAVRIN